MNRSDLTRTIAKKFHVPHSLVEEIIDAFHEYILMAMAVDEEVHINGFGKFRSRELKPRTLRNAHDGGELKVGPRKSMYFRPSLCVRRRLNDELPAKGVPDKPGPVRKRNTRPKPKPKPKPKVPKPAPKMVITRAERDVIRTELLQEAHDTLWARTDSQQRVTVRLDDLCEAHGCSRSTAARMLNDLREQRRIRLVKRGLHKLPTYEVADPFEFDPDRPPPQRPLRWE